jgi:hypothetical protein
MVKQRRTCVQLGTAGWTLTESPIRLEGFAPTKCVSVKIISYTYS